MACFIAHDVRFLYLSLHVCQQSLTSMCLKSPEMERLYTVRFKIEVISTS